MFLSKLGRVSDRKFDSAWVPARRDGWSGGEGLGERGSHLLILTLQEILQDVRSHWPGHTLGPFRGFAGPGTVAESLKNDAAGIQFGWSFLDSAWPCPSRGGLAIQTSLGGHRSLV